MDYSLLLGIEKIRSAQNKKANQKQKAGEDPAKGGASNENGYGINKPGNSIITNSLSVLFSKEQNAAKSNYVRHAESVQPTNNDNYDQ